MAKLALHTIGYEGSSIADFLATLEAVGVDLVIDVRDVPISRKAGFSKSALSAHLARHEIAYLHLKGLGDPKAGRIAAREGRHDAFRAIFAEHMRSSVAQSDLDRGIEAARGRVACLLCFERDHSACHRQLVAEAMVEKAAFRLVHLGVKGGAGRNARSREGLSLHDCAGHLG
jgi:uncharacterized protein (DUF488 family)